MRGTRNAKNRSQRANELLARLARGPNFTDIGGPVGDFTPVKAKNQYQMWVESWVTDELCRLLPELRDKLDQHGYVNLEVLKALRDGD